MQKYCCLSRDPQVLCSRLNEIAPLAWVAEYSLTGMATRPKEIVMDAMDRAAMALPCLPRRAVCCPDARPLRRIGKHRAFGQALCGGANSSPASGNRRISSALIKLDHRSALLRGPGPRSRCRCAAIRLARPAP